MSISTKMSAKDKLTVELIQKVIFGQNLGDISGGRRFWLSALRAASRNRVLYYFAVELQRKHGSGLTPEVLGKVSDIIIKGETWQNKLKNSLLFVNEHFRNAGIPFLVVKTRRDIAYVTYDVDILVKEQDYSRVNQILNTGGEFARHPGKQSQNQVNFFIRDMLTVDIHKDFSWQGFSYLDQDTVWKNTVESRIAGVSVPVPSAEIEFLLYSAHLIYERRHVTLLDLNNLVALSKEIKDPGLIKEQVKKFGWEGSFVKLLSLLNALTRQTHPFFRDEFTFMPLPRVELKAYRQLPYFLSPVTVLGFFWEKIAADKKIPFWDIAYYVFATTRYYLSRGKAFPYYREWYPDI